MERFRLRTYIESLAGTDELIVHDGPFDLVEIAALIDSNPKAVLVRNVGPDKAEVVGNVNASRARLAMAFGVAPDQLRAA